MNNKRWTKEEIEYAISLFNQFLTYKDITQKLNRTKISVRIKLHKLGYKFIEKNKKIKYCLQCNKELVSYQRKFCCLSCSATYTNKLRNSRIKCINCEKETYNIKFCSHKCCHTFKTKEKYKNIETGSIYPSRTMKQYLINKFGEKCMDCGWCKKHPLTNNVPIELEHINGNSEDNNIENLKLLCPNCHSLTLTYKALNIGKGRYFRKKRYIEGKSF